MATFRVGRYLRVSKTEQNTSLQEDETLAFLKVRGWELHDTYLDHGVSGAKAVPILIVFLAMPGVGSSTRSSCGDRTDCSGRCVTWL